MSTTDILRALEIDPDAPASSLTIGQHVEIQRRLLAPDKPPKPTWLPTREAARYARVSPKTLGRWAEDGHIERRGGSNRGGYRYLVSSIDAHIASGDTPAPEASVD